jgi:ribosomal protein S2
LNTDCNIKQAEYPIIANDASISSITFFVKAVKDAYAAGLAGSDLHKEDKK